MKTSMFTTSAIAAILGLAFSATANTCKYAYQTSANMIAADWQIEADGVEDIPGKCGGFWDNMNNRNFNGACGGLMGTSCEEVDGKMALKFTAWSSCNSGHVESAWYEATKNDYGAIECVQ